MIATKKAIPRRTVLRGVGTALALPLLDGIPDGGVSVAIGIFESCTRRDPVSVPSISKTLEVLPPAPM